MNLFLVLEGNILNISKQFILNKFCSPTAKYGFTLVEMPVVRKRGFTLIEMMIAIAIIGLVAATSVSVFQSQKNSKSVESVANEIRSKMMEAHAEAMSPPSSINGLKTVKIFTSGDIIYKQFVTTTGGGITPYYNIPKNVKVSLSPGINFDFIADNGSQIGQINGPNPIFEVSNKDNSIRYQVEIDKMTGNVTVKRS